LQGLGNFVANGRADVPHSVAQLLRLLTSLQNNMLASVYKYRPIAEPFSNRFHREEEMG
jgi:hypothetical protein